MENTVIEQKSDKKYKDTFFRKLYHIKEHALELGNALEGTDFPIDTPLEFFTQGDKSLVRRNNDLAFTINHQLLSITDHQGTVNPNMPIRLLPTAADILYTWLGNKRILYRNSLITIPTPKFYVLYNGKEKLKNHVLRLSDAFRFANHDFSIELEVKVIDINYNSGDSILQKCPSLNGYSYLIDRIRHNMNAGDSRDKAIKAAVNECIQKSILTDFLNDHYKEVCDMFDYGITHEEEIEVRVEEALEMGMKAGEEKGKVEGKTEGVLESALKFLQSGTSLADVVRILGLSDNQVQELEKQFA